jgi:excisionase family DNA binding protein
MSRPKTPRPTTDPWLSPDEVAAHWGTSRWLVDERIAAGELPARRLGPRLIRVRLSDADAALTPHKAAKAGA